MEVRIQSIHFDASEQLQSFVQKKVAKLEKFYDDIKKVEVSLKVVKPEGAIVAAGSLVLSNTVIEPGSIWGGVPAKFIKKVDPKQAKELNQKIAHNYLMYSDWYK